MAPVLGGFAPREQWLVAARRLVRFRHPLLLLVALLSAWALHDRIDWPLLSAGAHHLFSSSPLSAYAKTSGLQAGPPTLIVMRGLDLLPGSSGVWVAHVLLAVLGWYMVFLVERWTVAGARWGHAPLRSGLLTLLLGVPVLLQWGWLAGYTPHPEDALAILCFLLAMRAITDGRETRGALLIGLAMAFKPWAVVALPMVWGCSRKSRAAVLAIAVPAVCWLPFLIGDPGTLSAVGSGFVIRGNSPLSTFGLFTAGIPTWWRTVQLLGALAVAALAARRDWRYAFAAGCAMRLLLDPASFGYYLAGLLMATMLTDRFTGKRPWRTVVIWACAGYFTSFASPTVVSALQCAAFAVVIVAWIQPWRWRFGAPRDRVPRQRRPAEDRAELALRA